MSQPRSGERRIKPLEKVQTLIGRAMAAYENDRSNDRASRVMEPLREAFDIVVTLRSRTKP
jgi:hypothetical protein